MGILDRIREHKHEGAPGPSAHAEPVPVTGDTGARSVRERIDAAEELARSAGFHVPEGADARVQQIAALAVPGDGSVPRRLVTAFDAETDDDVRMGIVTALTDLFIDVDERYQLAGIRGVQLTHEDKHTLMFLRAELPRLIEEVQRAQGAVTPPEGASST